jgi:hypothetical protein
MVKLVDMVGRSNPRKNSCMTLGQRRSLDLPASDPLTHAVLKESGEDSALLPRCVEEQEEGHPTPPDLSPPAIL